MSQQDNSQGAHDDVLSLPSYHSKSKNSSEKSSDLKFAENSKKVLSKKLYEFRE